MHSDVACLDALRPNIFSRSQPLVGNACLDTLRPNMFSRSQPLVGNACLDALRPIYM